MTGVACFIAWWEAAPLLAVIAFLGFGLYTYWQRDRRQARLHDCLRAVHSLSEEIVAAGSAAEVAAVLRNVLPRACGASGVTLFLYSPSARCLLIQPANPASPPVTAALDTSTGPGAGAALCFRNSAPLVVADTRRSPLFRDLGWHSPRAVALLPMFARKDLLGVLQLDYPLVAGPPNREVQAALQHLANQVALALKLAEQQAMREQFHQSEKLAATGQLVSGLAGEISAPLQMVRQRIAMLLARLVDPATLDDLRVIRENVDNVAGAVDRWSSAAGVHAPAGRREAPAEHAASPTTAPTEARAKRRFTALVVEPEAAGRAHLVALLGELGHRVVPVTSAEEAVDLLRRLRFDVLFCAVQLPGMNWVEFFAKVRQRVGAFVLMTEGHNEDLARAVRTSHGHLLQKPVTATGLNRILDSIAERLAARTSAP